MIKKALISGFAVAMLGFGASVAIYHSPVLAAEEVALPSRDWSFGGLFGTFELAELQRGFQVYREVCSACHSLNMIAFRNLAELGYSEEEIKALAAEYTVEDGPDDNGEMFERPGRPSDRFPAPFPNVKAAAAANGGAAPPDLSLMAEARAGGPDYIHALLTGYKDPPSDFDLMEGLHYNSYFPGHQIAMAPPLSEDVISYEDGTEATVDQMSHDVAAFLMWSSEPILVERKQTGLKVILFLLVLTALLYAVKRKIWVDVH